MTVPASLMRFSDELEQMLLRFEDAWNEGVPTDLRGFCPPQSDLAFVKELVRIDMARRKSRNLPIEVCRYMAAFPELESEQVSLNEFASCTNVDSKTPCTGGALSLRPAPGYEILGELGRGGMGIVYKARQTNLNRVVALKMIRSSEIASNEELARFRGEAEAVAALTHRHIVQLHEFGTHDGMPYFTLEYMPGGSLADRVKDAPLAARDAAELVEGLALGVAEAHLHNVIHRDLKPGNVLLAADGTPKIADFGLAKRADAALTDASLTRTGDVIGTPQYMSPEQARGEKNIGPATDIWALGAILYRVLTGRPPFLGATAMETIQQVTDSEPISPRSLVPTTPRDLETICAKCLQKEPARRYATAKELAEDLRRFLDGQPILARPVSVLERGVKWARRRPAAATALGLLVSLVIGLGIGLWAVNRERRRTATERDQKNTALETETKARILTMNTLRKLTDDVVEKQMLRRVGGLTDDDKRFLREIQAQYEEFATLAGSSAEQRIIQAEGRYRVASISATLGETAAAESHYTQALELYRDLLNELPAHAGVRKSRARARNNLGLLYLTTGRPKQAEAILAESLAEKVHLANESPADMELQFDLASTHAVIGRLCYESDRLADAAKSYSTAIEIQKRSVAQAIDRPEYRQQLALNYYNLADIYNNLGKSKEAETACAEAIALQKSLSVEHPTRVEYRRDLAGSYHVSTILHLTSARLTEAIEMCRAALSIRKKLVAEFPVHFEMRQELSLSYNLLGILLGKTKKDKEADEALAESQRIQEQLAIDFPNVPDCRHDLAGTMVNRASLARNRGDYVGAQRLLAEAQPHHLAALQSNPQHPGYRQYYQNNRTLLVLVSAETGDPAAAIAAASQIQKLGWNPTTNAYHAAVLMATCADFVDKNQKLSPTEKPMPKKQYADHAMEMLRQAVAAGFSDTARLKGDPALENIRSREDFKLLLRKIDPTQTPVRK